MSSENSHIITLLLVTALVTYYTPIPMADFDILNVKFNTNKIYMVLFTSLIITLTDVLLNRGHFTTKNLIIWLVILIVGIIINFYLIQEQYFVTNASYLDTLLDNHKIDIAMGNKMLEHDKIDDDTKKVVNNIIKNRQDEVNDINNLLQKPNN